jgi:hypothetical protein
VTVKNAPIQGTGQGGSTKRTGFFFDFREQWSQLVRRCNWYEFTIIEISGEFAPYTGRWEFNLALLGLCVCLTWVYDGEFNEMMVEEMAEIMRERAEAGGDDAAAREEP